MCGITGIINFNSRELNISGDIRKMTQAIKHRGPDGEGFLFCSSTDFITAGSKDTPETIWNSAYNYHPQKNIEELANDYSIALGHRRLSIIDLSPAGHQPMCSANREVWITYNGELYNYIELREELKNKGHHFITNTDTEVILAAYQEWQEECLNKFNGMWAFVIYDRTKNTLFGSRDRFGVKPLYYFKNQDVFAFASEQKAFMKLPFIKKEINPKAVFDFFMKGEIEAEEEGFFKNIIELLPSYAFTLNVKTNEFKKWKYYTLEVNEVYEPFDELKSKDISERLEELLINAIALRLRSDVPVGSCLSGGVDSSSIVGIIHHLLSKDNSINIGDQLKVFTASFKDKHVNESHWAKIMVNKTKADWHETFPTSAELLKDLEQLIYCQDIPIWSTSTYAQYKVMQLVKENGVKVILDGQGGDELFAGYNTYNPAYWMELLSKSKINEFSKELGSFDGFPKNISFFLKQYLRFYGIKKLPEALQLQINKTYFDDISYLNDDFLNTHKKRISSITTQGNSLNQTLNTEFHNRLKGYLKCEDRCSMWHSVESRTPFADDIHLIEYAFKIPGAYKIHNSVNKYILKESVKKFVPSEIINRTDKKGYTTPNNKWIVEMKDDLKDLFTDNLKDYIDVNKLKKDYEQFFNIEQKPENGRIFKFISFAQWKKTFEL